MITYMTMPMATDDAARMKAASIKASLAEEEPRFQGRGFSPKVVEGILTNRIDIDAPERFLAMTPSEIAALGRILDIGERGVTEIEAYRRRFLPNVKIPVV
jgi:hypothetical protein